MSGILYLVGTPIGNMGDITLRAIETLNEVDIIACEDTRHSSILLQKLEIKKPLISYYLHKERQSGQKIIDLLLEGKNVALITDAGMPCISDPGAILVQMAYENDIKCTVVPAATAVASAMALSGITRRGFCFLGFLPEKNKDRDNLLIPYKCIDIQLVFYSSPHNINSDLDYLYSVLGDRNVVIVKEITKLFERVEKGILGNIHIEEPRGEYVVIVEGKDFKSDLCELSVEEHLRYNLDKGLSKKEAIKLTATERNVNKDIVYKVALNILD
ncbi:MAG: 16S rRNA (cytidine(1402)-2'-O)-methyltransferase [Clostridia bacterium]|nr:16S rRNA (cytidine(1402)-2'-O)-methyltransferase [Clostridia bacterium]